MLTSATSLRASPWATELGQCRSIRSSGPWQSGSSVTDPQVGGQAQGSDAGLHGGELRCLQPGWGRVVLKHFLLPHSHIEQTGTLSLLWEQLTQKLGQLQGKVSLQLPTAKNSYKIKRCTALWLQMITIQSSLFWSKSNFFSSFVPLPVFSYLMRTCSSARRPLCLLLMCLTNFCIPSIFFILHIIKWFMKWKVQPTNPQRSYARASSTELYHESRIINHARPGTG